MATAAEELFSSPVGRDVWARVGHMTAAGAYLAVSGAVGLVRQQHQAMDDR